MKNKTRKNNQFGFFSLADRTSVGHKLRGRRTQNSEKHRTNGLKQKRWFSIHFIQEST
ncbi:hypothetical protein [Flagellimonas meridianipacifica]|uniref:Uncharacterized protein n=1 Tax=Flagellimonas meridianipacifica TaxID=1080225 RepID=A0A2T0MFW9_9FLAO|nr:hypothetical protein [Allomuricauda pacifica]PRX56426.1 hypothetical protein CLV81_0423 [Allomuricauda pacifica]